VFLCKFKPLGKLSLKKYKNKLTNIWHLITELGNSPIKQNAMKTIDKVLKQLNEDSRTRDNDNLLIAKIWFSEMTPEEIGKSSLDFLTKYSKSEFTSAESIRRCRQKLQEEYPGLRGVSYTSRHNVKYQEIFK
jgi:oligoribonuclease (3'-5' exoribonuclease)